MGKKPKMSKEIKHKVCKAYEQGEGCFKIKEKARFTLLMLSVFIKVV